VPLSQINVVDGRPGSGSVQVCENSWPVNHQSFGAGPGLRADLIEIANFGENFYVKRFSPNRPCALAGNPLPFPLAGIRAGAALTYDEFRRARRRAWRCALDLDVGAELFAAADAAASYL